MSMKNIVTALSVSTALSANSTYNTERLTVVNACETDPIWIASTSNVPDQRSIKLAPGARHTYNIPQDLHSTRFWPKMSCNSEGQECKMGDSGGPGQSCTKGVGCGPPVDSKFEASFGHQGADCKTDAAVCDWWDTSAVDGFTLPYKVEISDACKTNGYKGSDIDCSALTLATCPTDESIPNVGNVNLQTKFPGTGEVVGCYSPCSGLTTDNWKNKLGTHKVYDNVAGLFCCPTPPISAAQCRSGPVGTSQYSNLIHSKCPGVYSYAYDDANGLQACPPETTYVWTLYCPGGTPSPPSPPPSPPTPSPSPPPGTWSPCTSSSAHCCNPTLHQVCPNKEPCEACGGGTACECPSGPAPSPGPTPAPPATWEPCSSSSTACCNPHISPKQVCPGSAKVKCEACGGGDACQCPSSDSTVVV